MKARSYKGYLAEGDAGYVRRCMRESLRGKKALLRKIDCLLEAAVLLPVCKPDAKERADRTQEVYALLGEILDKFGRHGVRVNLPPILKEQSSGRGKSRRADCEKT